MAADRRSVTVVRSRDGIRGTRATRAFSRWSCSTDVAKSAVRGRGPRRLRVRMRQQSGMKAIVDEVKCHALA